MMAKGKGISTPKMDDDWQTEDDLRTMCRAKEIMMDEKRHGAVKEMAKKKMTDMAALASGEHK